MKKRIHFLLNENLWFIRAIYLLIIVNVLALVAESYAIENVRLIEFLHWLEVISIGIFTIEYILRIWSADLGASGPKESMKMRLSFIFSFYGIIDLLAILPFFLPLLMKLDLRAIRILRLFRLLRIFKIGRYSKSLKLISEVLRETRTELFLTLFICFVLMIFSSTLMYYIEHDAQPTQFSDVGQSLWWSVATLTTVGYGDIYPITPMGKLLGAFIALIGIGFVALPTGIISSAFISRINSEKKEIIVFQCTCPNCNTSFEIKQIKH